MGWPLRFLSAARTRVRLRQGRWRYHARRSFCRDGMMDRGSKNKHKYVKQLSFVPEAGTLTNRFTFVIIGPQAHAVVHKISEANLHLEVKEYVRRSVFVKRSDSEDGLIPLALNYTDSQDVHGDDEGTYCM